MGPLAMLGIGAASGLVSSGMNMVNNFAGGIWNRNNQAYLQENAKNQQLDLISKSPQAYVSGLEQAGLNPMLAYGSPSAPMSSSSASNGPQNHAPSSGNTGKELKSLIKFLKEVKKL